MWPREGLFWLSKGNYHDNHGQEHHARSVNSAASFTKQASLGKINTVNNKSIYSQHQIDAVTNNQSRRLCVQLSVVKYEKVWAGQASIGALWIHGKTSLISYLASSDVRHYCGFGFHYNRIQYINMCNTLHRMGWTGHDCYNLQQWYWSMYRSWIISNVHVCINAYVLKLAYWAQFCL